MVFRVRGKDRTLELETINFYAFGVSGRGEITWHDAPDLRQEWLGVLPWQQIDSVEFVKEEGE